VVAHRHVPPFWDGFRVSFIKPDCITTFYFGKSVCFWRTSLSRKRGMQGGFAHFEFKKHNIILFIHLLSFVQKLYLSPTFFLFPSDESRGYLQETLTALRKCDRLKRFNFLPDSNEKLGPLD
jgi:hypothetical protein